jgi:D-glycero-beta-D-manno-heptose 1-phosphate adenylyltransferase
MRTDTLTELSRLTNLRAGKRLVFTNGCFDILHVGHIRYLSEARALGDLLVVGLNSDSSVSGLKGPGRPVVPEDQRREVLSALRSVDSVCIFEEETPLELIKALKPEVLVKGGDWPVEKIVGSDVVLSIGGIVRSLSFHQGHSSSGLIQKIQKL